MDRSHLQRNKMKPELQAYLQSLTPSVQTKIDNAIDKGECDVGKLNEIFNQMNLASTKPNSVVNNEMDKVMKGLNLQGGNGPNEGNNNVESQESQAKGLALLITAIDQLPIESDQQPTNQNKLFGYATRFYNKFLTTVDDCIKIVWNDTLKASLASYVGGKLALMTISNPRNIYSFINTLMTTIGPYVSTGTGILSTVALGTLIRKVFGHYATTTAIKAGETKEAILELNTKILKMTDKEVVDELKKQSSELSNATTELFQSLKTTDYDALARSLPEIDFNLDKRDKSNVGHFDNVKRRKINNDPTTVALAPTTVAPTTIATTTVAGLDDGTIEESYDEESNTTATTTVAGLDDGTIEESYDEESNTTATTTAATIFKAPPAAGDSTAANAMDIEGDDAAGDSTATRKRTRDGETVGNGKRKSKKRQTKNKKNKARKTKKNKRSSKKKVHKKK